MKTWLTLMACVLASAGCRGCEAARPLLSPPVHAVAAQPEQSPPSAAANGAVWTSTTTTESSLGPLNCYSQAAMDGCAGRAQPAPEGACEQVGAQRTSVVWAGMACTDCLTDCWCRAKLETRVCR